jgi:hypothetical protein
MAAPYQNTYQTSIAILRGEIHMLATVALYAHLGDWADIHFFVNVRCYVNPTTSVRSYKAAVSNEARDNRPQPFIQ